MATHPTSYPSQRERFRRVVSGLLLLLCAGAGVAMAQSSPTAADLERLRGLDPAQREALLREAQRQDATVTEAVLEPGRQTLPDSGAVVLPMSGMESSGKALVAAEAAPLPPGETEMFGADFFRGEPGLFGAQTFGPVPSEYLMGPGDEIAVDVWGQVEFRYERVVERDGSFILPRAGRIAAANRTLGEVTRSVREALSRSYSGIDPSGNGGTTFVEVSLGRLRPIRVFVVGEVRQPGAYELTSVSTVLTALYAAGGPAEQGSMRRVRLIRGLQEVAELDLYRYLLEGVREGDAILREGDTVFVPARTTTVRISGEVRRNLSFELLEGEGIRDLLRYAGGFTPHANTALVHVERILPPTERAADRPDLVQRDLLLEGEVNHALLDGDRVTVDRIPDRLQNFVTIKGNVKHPARYEFEDGATIVDLIARAGGLWEDTLLERATLDRIEPDGTYRSQAVPLGQVLDGSVAAPALRAQDELTVFSIWDVQDRPSVSISGEVRAPGTFPWREDMTLREVVLKAGGLRESADVLHAEIARVRDDAAAQRGALPPAEGTVDMIRVELGAAWLDGEDDVRLQPHDRIAVRRLPWWELQRMVAVRGEVLYPGDYALDRPGERLSSVISRAGGLKPTAFALGARLVRSRDSIGNVAIDLRSALEDPGSDHDLILEEGDTVLIPPEPYTVRVAGGVNFPTSVVWEDGKGLGDYVRSAGGYSRAGDKWRTHVVYANGMSQPIRRFWGDPRVEPGATIVVPLKEEEEGQKLQTLREITAIFASLATVWLVIERTD